MENLFNIVAIAVGTLTASLKASTEYLKDNTKCLAGLIKDLVVDMEHFYHNLRAVQPYLITSSPRPVKEPRNPAATETAKTIAENAITVMSRLRLPFRFALQAGAVQDADLAAL